MGGFRVKHVLSKKKLFLLILTISIIISTVIVVAWQSNWFKAADIKGTIAAGETEVLACTIDFGTLNSSSEFTFTNTSQITVVEENLTVTAFFLWQASRANKQYLQARFANLYINITIVNQTQKIPVVQNGVAYNGWSLHTYGSTPTDFELWKYNGWQPVVIPRGTHEIIIVVYGKTALTTTPLSVDIAIYIELTP